MFLISKATISLIAMNQCFWVIKKPEFERLRTPTSIRVILVPNIQDKLSVPCGAKTKATPKILHLIFFAAVF